MVQLVHHERMERLGHDDGKSFIDAIVNLH